ncbi:DUF1501 domain-containing protein [Rhodoferax aquaticus]|uniref:DUF1501 domain-containing protein n=1 Tax=Rhodoferax aquaticus TaxID=2527691 RepID=A0A515ESU0_9BURK|nr:DUF1501 domain-containing protein [Rhodoferax aquaticus]QDL55736.1 DUF1501 domain-containing protein [Rhodoferax aquaticus]
MPQGFDFTLQRRTLLQGFLGAGAVYASPVLWAQSKAPAAADARLVVLFLRGAYDGLSALVPHGDANYYRLRSSIAIPKPDGSEQSAIKLDNMFGLHPAMAALLPLWQQGVLTALPCAGSPDPTRSHFDAQHHWEIGVPGKSGSGDGWMNALAAQRAAAAASASGPGKALAVGVGEANPLILAGSAPVQLVPKGQAATRQGALGDARTRDAVMKLYSGQDKLSEAFRAGAESRMQTAQTLSADMADTGMAAQEMQAANNGAGNSKGLLLDAQHLATLMRQDRRLRLGFLSAGGWDTHANQGGVTGALAQNLGNLAATLVQLRKDFSQPNDMVVVCSEFGRTSAENGTRGTDHGHGNALWLMGNQVQGGRAHGRWEGLANGNLHEGRDLPVHHDFRAVLAQVLRHSQGVGTAELDRLFPGYAWDAQLDGLMRS